MTETDVIQKACFFAHSAPGLEEGEWQPLAEHLRNVGDLAGAFASVFNGEAAAQASGLLHDLGKYTAEFQQRLRGDALRVDHSSWGAIVAARRFGALGQLLAYGIAGHHAGLANGAGEGERTPLAERLQLELPSLDDVWQREIQLPEKLGLPTGFKVYGNDGKQAKERQGFQLAFLTRMLFSCLVDADFLDTERFYNRIEKRRDARHADLPTLGELRDQLNRHLAQFKPEGDVNRLRADVLNHVRAQAAQPPGLFSLTVPTGGGKTLASLAFALDHAIQHGLRRVIFVIPFTSIVEQNAKVFRDALGPLGDVAVLEHHSAFIEREPAKGDLEHYQAQEKLKLAAENWDAPIIVTTAVQFFESLFAAKPSQCRKLHRIAGSVVVLDEAQTMPLKLLRPCVAAIDELARNYRASVVLCTATQPALEAPEFEGGLPKNQVCELAPEPARLFQQLQRVRVRPVGILSDAALAAHMRSRDQVLCIVNNRKHARAVYQTMADLPGARHLTTYMCARHRSAVLADVRQMLRDGAPCRLVATSLIEAGVDVDFPTVLRAEAGLDSIAQAAGRCNREGLRAVADSEVLVFAAENPDWAPPAELRQYAQAGREVLRNLTVDPLEPEAMRRYFELLYWQKGSDQLDKPNLMGLLQASRIDSLPMETLATKFRMIDNVQMPVIIQWHEDETDHKVDNLLDSLKYAKYCTGIARELQPYLVQVPQRAFTALFNAGAVSAVEPSKWGDQFMKLHNMDIYDTHFGLCADDPTFVRSEHLNW